MFLDDDDKILPGQMCYDELDPVEEKDEKPPEREMKGQLSFDDLSSLNQQEKHIQNNEKNTTINTTEEVKNIQNISEKKDNKNNQIDENKQEIYNNKIIAQKLEKNVQCAENSGENKNIKEIKSVNNNENNFEKEIKRERAMAKENVQNGESRESILYKSLEDVLHESMIPYTEHVVMDRALPRVEDGLKPVQRRILYAMYDMGLVPDKPFRKSATVVGECLGHYHPHGDTSVYDAAVRMAQDFSMRDVLIDGHGNFGSIDGDGAAAYRYTEMKLKPLALELLKDIEKDTVHWSLNFDDSRKEPDTLPGRFPNLLVNGAYGIAVGVATNIPPHNLSEVIDAVVAYIDKPSINTKGLMKYIKGPDFPTGANIILTDELANAYETGKGKITIRATVDIETAGDKQYLVIKDIPYQVNKAQLLQKIAELKETNKDKLSAIQEIRDESDRNGIRAVIRLKKEANAKSILEYLYKSTNLQTTFGINMVAIAGGKPKQMGLVDIISYYVEYQRQVVYRRTKYDLDVCKDRAHILEGLLIAIKNIDEVIKIIKNSESVSVAKTKLKERFLLSEKQTTAILDMRLSRLVNLEVNKIQQELADLKIKIEELTAIYLSKAKQYDVVKKEILEIKKEYKTPRLTHFIDPSTMETQADEPEEVVVRDVLVASSASGTIKSIPIKNYNLSTKEITDNTSLNEIHTNLVKAKTTDTVLIFTNLGNTYKVLVDKLPEAKWRERGSDLNKLDKNLSNGETPVAIINVSREAFQLESANVVIITESGMIKKSPMSEYLIAKNVFSAIKLKEKDKVVAAFESDDRYSIVIGTKTGMVVNIADDMECTGRTTSGVKAIALDDGDKVIGAVQAKKSGALTVLTSKGYVKNVSVGEYELSARNRKGLRITGKDTGDLRYIYFGIVPPNIAVFEGGSMFEIKSKYIPYDNRVGKGKQILKDEFKSAHTVME